jgi:hypothetical protein
VEKAVIAGDGGRPVVRDAVEVRWTLDERIQNGYYCASSRALIKQAMEDPETVFGLPAAVARDGSATSSAG